MYCKAGSRLAFLYDSSHLILTELTGSENHGKCSIGLLLVTTHKAATAAIPVTLLRKMQSQQSYY